MSKGEFVTLAAARYDELQALDQLDNFYDYKKRFVGIWRESGRQILEKTRAIRSGITAKKRRSQPPWTA